MPLDRYSLPTVAPGADAFTLPAGYGMRRLTAKEFAATGSGLRGLFDLLLVFEPPRRRPRHQHYRYIMAIDTSDGLGQDRSVIDIVRVPTIQEPAEQVAQFVSDQTSAEDLAPIADAIGRWYCDGDQYEALAMIEINGHGKSTQDLLQKHYGYTHFFRWQYLDKAQMKKRFSQAIGWSTTPQTRPVLLGRFVSSLRQVDPLTKRPGLIIHSPVTFEDLSDFYSPTGLLADAEATRGNHDDCVMSLAMANYAIIQLFEGEDEPIAEQRRRRQIEDASRARSAATARLDYRNTDRTADEMQIGLIDPDLDTLTDNEMQDMIEAAALSGEYGALDPWGGDE